MKKVLEWTFIALFIAFLAWLLWVSIFYAVIGSDWYKANKNEKSFENFVEFLETLEEGDIYSAEIFFLEDNVSQKYFDMPPEALSGMKCDDFYQQDFEDSLVNDEGIYLGITGISAARIHVVYTNMHVDNFYILKSGQVYIDHISLAADCQALVEWYNEKAAELADN